LAKDPLFHAPAELLDYLWLDFEAVTDAVNRVGILRQVGQLFCPYNPFNPVSQ
jgi:hypothetical protein